MCLLLCVCICLSVVDLRVYKEASSRESTIRLLRWFGGGGGGGGSGLTLTTFDGTAHAHRHCFSQWGACVVAFGGERGRRSVVVRSSFGGGSGYT